MPLLKVDKYVIKHDYNYDSCWEYNNPTLEHINEMREARKNEIFTYVGLRKCRKQEEFEQTVFYYFVEAQLKSFDGSETYTVSKVIDTETQEIDD